MPDRITTIYRGFIIELDEPSGGWRCLKMNHSAATPASVRSYIDIMLGDGAPVEGFYVLLTAIASVRITKTEPTGRAVVIATDEPKGVRAPFTVDATELVLDTPEIEPQIVAFKVARKELEAANRQLESAEIAQRQARETLVAISRALPRLDGATLQAALDAKSKAKKG